MGWDAALAKASERLSEKLELRHTCLEDAVGGDLQAGQTRINLSSSTLQVNYRVNLMDRAESAKYMLLFPITVLLIGSKYSTKD